MIKERIETGVYQPGDQLPSVLKIQEEFGVATATGQKVLHQLRKDGLSYTEPGMGTFVKQRSPGEAHP
ncbi:winged helix-turn-helix transcriptional regulator [Nonomuraea sp. K274]|uniref:Winged helix-turn-helix transcriptional regulator n=1 Tax=Nonomuraea cypriaca TaxID=1187855 RepID=A0A931AA24_9ACTN|nr:winged helix-turn-helix transcriptional regulator [Nonomuraea cypriaca]